jgi:hypothetical protein
MYVCMYVCMHACTVTVAVVQKAKLPNLPTYSITLSRQCAGLNVPKYIRIPTLTGIHALGWLQSSLSFKVLCK